MNPGLASTDVADRWSGDSVVSCNSSLGVTAPPSFYDDWYVAFCELGGGVVRANWMDFSPFQNLVEIVIGIGSEPKVAGIAAGRVVAGVADGQAFGYWGSCLKNPGNDVRSSDTSLMSGESVSFRSSGTGPFPATVFSGTGIELLGEPSSVVFMPPSTGSSTGVASAAVDSDSVVMGTAPSQGDGWYRTVDFFTDGLTAGLRCLGGPHGH